MRWLLEVGQPQTRVRALVRRGGGRGGEALERLAAPVLLWPVGYRILRLRRDVARPVLVLHVHGLGALARAQSPGAGLCVGPPSGPIVVFVGETHRLQTR